MGLPLHAVAPLQGWRWIVQAFALWQRRPLSFLGLFATFLFFEMLLMGLIPLAGSVLGMGLLPMLSLGFMIAARSVLAGGPAQATQFADGLRHPDRARRKAQWKLCALYAAASVVVIALSDWADGGSLDALMRAASEPNPDKRMTAVEAALQQPQLLWGLLARFGLAGLLSVPFWYAPALVHWGAQSAGQALFSSTVAVWRARGAFTVYALGWAGLLAGLVALGTVLMSLLGTPRLAGLLAMPLALVFSAAFYLSLWFGFCDSFGAPQPDQPPGTTAPPV